MNYATPIRDRLAFKGEPLSTDELTILDKTCNISIYEPYLANDGDGAIVTIFDFGESIHHNDYFAIEKSNYYKFFLIGFTLLSGGGSTTTNIAALSSDNLDVAANVLKEYIKNVINGEKWTVRGLDAE
jgi:hypothetical protein